MNDHGRGMGAFPAGLLGAGAVFALLGLPALVYVELAHVEVSKAWLGGFFVVAAIGFAVGAAIGSAEPRGKPGLEG